MSATKLCNYETCQKRASFGLNRYDLQRCPTHATEEMKRCSTLCKCGEAHPNFNLPGEKRAICCSNCKTADMVDVMSKKCKCGKAQPHYNLPGEKTAICCSSCKTADMVNVKSKKCKCGTTPSFNLPGENTAICCASCKTADMVNVMNKKCECGSGKVARFNLPDEKTAVCCSDCKTAGMVDVKSRKCRCGKHQPIYNLPDEVTAICCSSCKTDDMINVKDKKCKCGKIPNFNLPGEKRAICCSNCKTADMVDVMSRKCRCGKSQPTYNLPGERIAICCTDCKTQCMVDIKHNKCKQALCDVRAQNPQYEGYCLGCFMHNFPDKPVARNYKTKEAAVAKFIMETFPEMSWVWDVRVMDGCSGRRPDLVCDMGPYVMIIEVDERQHRDYVCACENKRMMLISQDVGHKPIVFIRFNPDAYLTNKGRVSSCWKHNKQSILVVPKEKQRDWSGRLEALKNAVEYWRVNDPAKMIEVVEMFYDENWMVAAAAERTSAAGGSACHVEADDE
jgi:hypothetical protein